MKEMSVEIEVTTSINDFNADGQAVVIPAPEKEGLKLEAVVSKLPAWIKSEFAAIARKRKFEAKPTTFLAFDGADGVRKAVVFVDPKSSQFELLTFARSLMGSLIFDVKVKRFALDLTHTGQQTEMLADAIVSASAAKIYKFPKYTTPKKDSKESKKEKDADDLSLGIIVQKSHVKKVEDVALTALNATTAGTNVVRWLAKRSGNDLDCKTYIDYVRRLAKDRKWSFKLHGHSELQRLKAGAFLSVVQGSNHKDYGIVELTYAPKVKTAKTLALVGKGLTFDTGGHCLKPSQYMLGMHGDMAGSAVALAVLNVATLEQWPVKIKAYLAIADNMIGPSASKPNDVITAMNGTTIEVIDTDAEGRLVLADTLHLASKEKPQLMMDFATLTGACLRAIGTTYSGVFTNREELHGDLIQAGKRSGERVWPFPMDKDFAECLESTVADYKNCREKGGVDHIEAAQFLMHFAGDKSPWVHLDLSAIEHGSGLAHVPSTETGFGVRFASEFIKGFFKI